MGMDMFGTSFVVAAAVCDLELTMQQRALLTAMPLLGKLSCGMIFITTYYSVAFRDMVFFIGF